MAVDKKTMKTIVSFILSSGFSSAGQEHVNSPEAWKKLFSQAVEDLGKGRNS